MKMTKTIVLESPLDPDAVLERVRSGTDPYPTFAPWVPRHGKPLLGNVVANSVSLRLRPRYFGKNSLGALFTAVVEPGSVGSSVRGDVGPDHVIRALLWFGFIFGLCACAVMAILALIPTLPFGAVGVAAGIAMTLWWVGIVFALSLPHCPQRRRLVETVRALVDGTERHE